MEKIKLENRTKIMIIFHIVMVIFSTVTAIVENDFTWILCALLWGNIAIIEYCDAKLLKGKDLIYDLQDELIESQNETIIKLLNEIKSTEIIQLDTIKVPECFTKPRQNKLRIRTEYYKLYHQFEVPIIIDENNNLVDGYTTYLIAKQNKFSHIQIQRKKESK